jgi:hypothetical protein
MSQKESQEWNDGIYQFDNPDPENADINCRYAYQKFIAVENGIPSPSFQSPPPHYTPRGKKCECALVFVRELDVKP